MAIFNLMCQCLPMVIWWAEGCWDNPASGGVRWSHLGRGEMIPPQEGCDDPAPGGVRWSRLGRSEMIPPWEGWDDPALGGVRRSRLGSSQESHWMPWSSLQLTLAWRSRSAMDQSGRLMTPCWAKETAPQPQGGSRNPHSMTPALSTLALREPLQHCVCKQNQSLHPVVPWQEEHHGGRTLQGLWTPGRKHNTASEAS